MIQIRIPTIINKVVIHCWDLTTRRTTIMNETAKEFSNNRNKTVVEVSYKNSYGKIVMVNTNPLCSGQESKMLAGQRPVNSGQYYSYLTVNSR
jgi:hypothetical protein